MKESESIGLSWIRVLAMMSVVVCHLFQAYNSKYANVVHGGVQTFLVMSGYLYGNKVVTDWRKFAKKRINKVYLPYLVFLILVVPLYAFFHVEEMKWNALPFYFANLQGFRLLIGGDFGRIEGLRHVWYITAIMCAYLTTPLLQRVRKHSTVVLPILLFIIAITYIFASSLNYIFVFSCLYLYAIGYFYVNLNKKWKWFYLILCMLAIFVILVNLQHGELTQSQFHGIKSRLLHDLGGILSVFGGVLILSRIKYLKVPHLISIIDKYSYHIFLVHFIIICGPFSMAYITPFNMLVTTVVATCIFIMVMNFVNKSFEKLSIIENNVEKKV